MRAQKAAKLSKRENRNEFDLGTPRISKETGLKYEYHKKFQIRRDIFHHLFITNDTGPFDDKESAGH